MLEGRARNLETPSRDLGCESFEISPLTAHIGAEIRGLDLSQPLSDRQDTELRRAFLDWMVLSFPDQQLSREQHTVWDNCTQHHAVWDYYPHSRIGERVSVLGEKRPSA